MNFKFAGKVIIVIVVATLLWFKIFDHYKLNTDDNVSNNISNQTEVEANVTSNTAEGSKSIKIFSDHQFVSAFDNLALPNIKPILTPPVITGNGQADSKIVALAEKRGYKLRFIARGSLNEIKGKPVQELLISSWMSLAKDANSQSINIDFVSGYRSIEDQRLLFLSRLYGAGASIESIIAGDNDDIVNSVLGITAPPGYSRHHSGYTIDVNDPDYGYFADSDAYGWLKDNNFYNAKKFGFIPSYPNNSNQQGPEPEPWEFVWVGTNITYQ